MTVSGHLTIVGLGPGDASLLTVEARDLLAPASEVWLRTARHPTVAGLPAGPRYESFDDVNKAIDREKQLKRWNRTKKDWLIAQKNPTWEDLAAEWYPEHERKGHVS